MTLTIPSVHYTPEGPWKVGATLTAQWAIARIQTAAGYGDHPVSGHCG